MPLSRADVVIVRNKEFSGSRSEGVHSRLQVQPRLRFLGVAGVEVLAWGFEQNLQHISEQ